MILKTIIDRLNQRIEVSNIFDRIYGLCELTGDKGWIYYIGDGQAIPVTDYDSKQGSLFWAKRGKVNISKIDSLKVSGCKQMYSTKFNLSAYAIVRKSHLPCDGEDAGDWVASRVYKLVSGRDYGFKEVIDVVSYEVIPNGYTVGDKTLPPNLEFATVVIDLEVEIVSGSEDTCYDICNTGDIPLPPDFLPCTPCLTEVAVDGVTIIGNGTPAEPLVAVGGGGGTPLRTQDEGVNVSTNTTTLNFTGAGVTASLTSPGVVQVNIPSGGGGGGVTAVTGSAPIASSGGATPDISISQATSVSDGYLSATDFNTFDGKQDALTAGTGIDLTGNIVTNTAPDQIVSLTAGTGIAVSGTYPSFTIDNTQDLSGYVPYTGATQDVDLGTHKISVDAVEFSLTPTNSPAAGQIAYVGNTGALAYNMNGSAVTSQIGQTMHAFVHNADSVTITKGQAVYLFGASGNKASVKLANNTGDATSAKTFGLAAENITSGQNGFITVQGVLDGLNTGAYTAGDTLYLGATAGSLTNVKPYAPNHLVYIGVVEKANNGNGQIYVRVQNGYELDEIHDVDLITTPPVNNDLLVYTTGVNNLWKNKSLGTILGGTTADYVRGDGSVATFPPIPTGTVTSVSATVPSPASPALSVAVSNPTTTPAIAITANGTTSQYVRGDGSLATFPTIPAITIYKNTTDQAAVTGTTANTKVVSVLIPANTITVGNIIEIKARAGKTGGAGITTLRVYVNTADSIVTPAPTLLTTTALASIAQNYIGIDRSAIVKTATNTQTAAATVTIPSDAAAGTAALTNSNVDWTQNQYIIFALQNGAAGDSTVLSYYQIEIK